MKRLILTTIFLLSLVALHAQETNRKAELEQISATLQDYIDGTSFAKPDQIRKAFHPDLNLYSIDQEGKLSIWKGTDYISRFEGSKASNRLGKILSIDYENDAAMAKVEIIYPNRPSVVYIDYFMLLKIEDKWTIVHKMFTKKQASTDD